jgi:hypothetical protein
MLRQVYKGFSSFSAFSVEKNRSEAKPGVDRPRPNDVQSGGRSPKKQITQVAD